MQTAKKVILIDDSDIDLIIQRRFLEVFNFTTELIQFRSAEEALDSLSNLKNDTPPDVIFLDLNMPEIDGFEFLKHFSQLPKKITDTTKIVVLSSSTNLTEKNKALEHKNVIHFLTKPITGPDIEDIKKLIRE